MSAPVTHRDSNTTSQAALRPGRSGPVQAQRHAIPSWVLKLVMAVTGIIWTAFAMIHLWGNMKVWLGESAFDGYAHWLRDVGYPLVPHEFVLWALRIVLATSIIIHVVSGLTLAFRGRHARGSVRAKPAAKVSRMMVSSGIIIFCFLIVHVLDLTMGVQPIAPEAFVAGSAYANLVASLSRIPMAIFYFVTMAVIAFHILHGIKVAATDLGTTTMRWRRIFAIVALLCALALVIGNGLIPIAVLTGWIA